MVACSTRLRQGGVSSVPIASRRLPGGRFGRPPCVRLLAAVDDSGGRLEVDKARIGLADRRSVRQDIELLPSSRPGQPPRNLPGAGSGSTFDLPGYLLEPRVVMAGQIPGPESQSAEAI